jgi:hypothetical protein
LCGCGAKHQSRPKAAYGTILEVRVGRVTIADPQGRVFGDETNRKVQMAAVLDSLTNWWYRAHGGPVVRDFGLIDEIEIDRNLYQTRAILRSHPQKKCLTLALSHRVHNQQVEFQRIFLHFENFSRIIRIFDDALQRMSCKTAAACLPDDPRTAALLKALDYEILCRYGRIDGHPENALHHKTELTLLKQKENYWFHFSCCSRSFFIWPTSLIQAINRLTLQML